MSRVHGVARVMRWTAGGLGLLAVGYATVAGTTWYRYGRVPSVSPDECDPLLDQFMPEYEVAESESIFAFPLGGEVEAEEQIPVLDSAAQLGPIEGSVAIFLLPDEASENRPLILHIPPAEGEDEGGEVTLDL